MRTRGVWERQNMTFRDEEVSCSNSQWHKRCPVLSAMDPGAYHVQEDDFTFIDPTATVGRYAVDTDAGGTHVTGDHPDGRLHIVTNAANNQGTTISTLHENWTMFQYTPMWIEFGTKITEADTNEANWAVGVSDVVTKDFLQDDGAGPPANYDGVCLFKVDGTMSIFCETSNGAAQSTSAALFTPVSGTYYRLGLEIMPTSATSAIVTPFINGVAYTQNTWAYGPTEQAMHIFFSVKSGDVGGGAAETFIIDYYKAVQVRYFTTAQ